MRAISRYSFLLLLTFSFTSFTQEKKAYELFEKSGKKASWDKMIKALSEADVVLFGEQHNNSLGHWLQYEVTEELRQKLDNKLILAAEMFETDNQLALNEYLNGTIPEDKFEKDSRLWNNYATDYRPLVRIAKKNNLPFVASNVPRRYASLVYAKGFDALNDLSSDAKLLLPPLPIPYDSSLECYSSLANNPMMGHANPNLPKAQALKDATMAYNINKAFSKDSTIIHYNGAYHSNSFQSIYWYLHHYNPHLKIITITMVEADDISKLKEESHGLADYIFAIDGDMTKTY